MRDRAPRIQRVDVAQLGGRRRYAVPRAFDARGVSVALHTDIALAGIGAKALGHVLPLLKAGSTNIRRLQDRRPNLSSRARLYNDWMLGIKYTRALRGARGVQDRIDTNLRFARTFSKNVASQLTPDANVFYGFSGQSLEAALVAKSLGRIVVIDQKGPPPEIEQELVIQEAQKYCHLYSYSPQIGDLSKVTVRYRQEWEIADVLICGSNFVRDCIVRAGGPSEKCRIVPYGLRQHSLPLAANEHGGPLRVLFIGNDAIRKGAHYAILAASELGKAFDVRLAGSFQLSDTAMKSIPENVKLLGSLSERDVTRQLGWADVLLLPTVAEGSAAVTYEALSAGVPVVATEAAGSVVENEVDGIIISEASVAAVVGGLRQLLDRDLLAALKSGALRTAATLTLEHYGAQLIDAIFEPFREAPLSRFITTVFDQKRV